MQRMLVLRNHRGVASAAATTVTALAVVATGLGVLHNSSHIDNNTTFADAAVTNNNHMKQKKVNMYQSSTQVLSESTKAKVTIPTYTSEEVSERNGQLRPEMWVSYKGNVYDITNFLQDHPGGKQLIQDAVGGPLEPFWGYWAYHTALDRPMDTLHTYWIGRLVTDTEEDAKKPNQNAKQDLNEAEITAAEDIENDLYAMEPKRDSMQIPLVQRPWCSETDPRALRNYITSSHAFYVRNHAPVPQIDKDDHTVSIGWASPDHLNTHWVRRYFAPLQETSAQLNVEALQSSYKKTTIHSVLQCAGNRGSEMVRIRPTAFTGTPFEHIRCGMIGNATWTGVRLRDVLLDVLQHVEKFKDSDDYHVEFTGVDGYNCSIPLKHALDQTSDVLLAFQMNGEDLLPDHGYPIRIFIPGVAGARSVKWLSSIKVQKGECSSCWHTTYYKKDLEGTSIHTMPMQCFLLSKQSVGRNHIYVQGIVWGGGQGVGIQRVQVSIDDGQSWVDAQLLPSSPSSDGATIDNKDTHKDESSREWSWVQFTAKVETNPKSDVPSTNDTLPIVTCRAIDKNGNIQPQRPWYPKGYLYNGWHQL